MGEFVVAGGDAPELFDAGKEALDQVAMLVLLLIEGALLFAGDARRDNGLSWHVGDLLQQGIGIERLVGDDGIACTPSSKAGACVTSWR